MAAFYWHQTIPFMNDVPIEGNVEFYKVFIQLMQPTVFIVEEAIRDGGLVTCSDLADAYTTWRDSFLASAHKYEASVDWTMEDAGALWKGAMTFMGDGTFTEFVDEQC